MNAMLNEFITMRRRHKKAVLNAEQAVDNMLEALAQVSTMLDDGNNDGDSDSMNVDSTDAVSAGGDKVGTVSGENVKVEMDDDTSVAGDTNGNNKMQIDNLNNNTGSSVTGTVAVAATAAKIKSENTMSLNNADSTAPTAIKTEHTMMTVDEESMDTDEKPTISRDKKGTSIIKVLEELLTKCKALQSNLVSEHKSVGNAMNKFGKAIDAGTETKLGELCAPGVRLDSGKIDDSIAQHLFREGLFDVGRTFVKEANVDLDEAKIKPFERLYEILNAFHHDDLQPAIEWTCEKEGFLKEQSSSNLRFRLHCLAYLQILQHKQDRQAALEYAKTHLSAFPQHIVHVQKLMTCLLYADNLTESPYSALVHPSRKDDVERSLSMEYCRSLGFTKDSLLLTVIRCGTTAIPTLLKATRIASNLQELGIDDALPVEIDVGRDCCFHSIFTCPVSKEEASDGNNVPMILLCGHVLSKQSILRLPRGTHRFKCPYCPMEQVIEECKELYI